MSMKVNSHQNVQQNVTAKQTTPQQKADSRFDKNGSLFTKEYKQVVVDKNGKYHTETRDAFGNLKWKTSFEEDEKGRKTTRRNDKDAYGNTFRSIDWGNEGLQNGGKATYLNAYGFPISKEEFDKLEP